MAELVAAFGVPHNPSYPSLARREGPGFAPAEAFGRVRADLEAARPELVVIVDTDHLNTFFLDNLPVFAVGVTPAFAGPSDEPPDMAVVTTPSDPAFAAHLRAWGVGAGFDLALAQDFAVDHSIAVPLHFLLPGRDVPVVPVFVCGHVPPLPAAGRCLALGEALAEAIAAWPGAARVAAIASGSFSLEVWGPRMAPGRPSGVPDPAWARRVCDHLEAGRCAELVAETTHERIARAGNVAGEILNWIVVLGMIAGGPADYVVDASEDGHAYAAWRLG